jgi:hypothetical protein
LKDYCSHGVDVCAGRSHFLPKGLHCCLLHLALNLSIAIFGFNFVVDKGLNDVAMERVAALVAGLVLPVDADVVRSLKVANVQFFRSNHRTRENDNRPRNR